MWPVSSENLSLPGECSQGCLWIPGICSPTRLGSCHLMGYFWEVFPNTVTVPLACDTAQKCLFQCGRGDGRQLGLSQPAQGLGPCLSKQRANTCWAPSSLLSFWDLGARCCCPALYFHTTISLEPAESLRVGLSPKSRHRAAQGEADVPVPRKKRPARCHPCTEQGQHTKDPFWKGLSQEKGQKA